MTNHRHDDDGDDLPDAAVARSQWVVLFSKWVKIKQQRRLYFSSSHSRKLSYMLDASSIHRTGRGRRLHNFTSKNQYFVRWTVAELASWRAGDYVKILKSADAPGFCWSRLALSLALRVISCIIVRRDEWRACGQRRNTRIYQLILTFGHIFVWFAIFCTQPNIYVRHAYNRTFIFFVEIIKK